MKCLIKNPNGTKRILKRTQKNARLSFSIIWSFLLRQMQSGFHHRRRLFREKIMGTKRRAFKSDDLRFDALYASWKAALIALSESLSW